MKAALTAERLREVLHYDPETGVFTWKARTSNRVKVGDEVGFTLTRGYVGTMLDGRRYKLHRLAWLYVYGVWPDGDIDHKDGIKDNNRISNLRVVDMSTNQQNLKQARSNSTSGLLGVHKTVAGRHGKKIWMARIKANGKTTCLGYFENPTEAHQVYLAAKRKLHEGCTI